MFTVSDLANKAQVSADTVRHYVKIGLLRPGRHAENSYKIFSQSDISLVQFIRNAKNLGLTLKEISEIVNHNEEDSTPCPRVREIIDQHIDNNRKKLNEMSILQYKMERALLQWKDMPNGMPNGTSVSHLINSKTKEKLLKNDVSKCNVCNVSLNDTHFIFKKNNLHYYYCSIDCYNSVNNSMDLSQNPFQEKNPEHIESRTIYLEEPLSKEVTKLIRSILSKIIGICNTSISDSSIVISYDLSQIEKLKIKEAINEIEIAIRNHWFDILRHRIAQLAD